MKDNVWFINFNGIGNGIMIAPVLKCFEDTYPEIKYFHTENEVLVSSWFKTRAEIKGPCGYSSIKWRRFKKEDWLAITDFIKENNIGTIVNLRNEGPKYDIGYYEFKKSFSERDIKYFDLDFDDISARSSQKNLTEDILLLFSKMGVDISKYNPKWLKDEGGISEGFGFGMVASQKNKRWPAYKWAELGELLKRSGKKMLIFSGKTEEEKEAANLVKESFGDSVDLVDDLPLEAVARVISQLSLFISNDTGLLHIAAASNIETVGIYITTDPDIWSPLDKSRFTVLKSKYFDRCHFRKIHCGNCVHYYDTCTVLSEYGDGIEPLDLSRIIETKF